MDEIDPPVARDASGQQIVEDGAIEYEDAIDAPALRQRSGECSVIGEA